MLPINRANITGIVDFDGGQLGLGFDGGTFLCRWDIHQIEIEDEQGTRQEWEYQEQIVDGWTLDDAAYLERVNGRQRLTDAGREYFAASEAEILEWAKAAGV